jgi:hypothetical protein
MWQDHGVPPAGNRPGGPDVQWDPWQPGQLAVLLRGVTAPWYVAGGNAIDLHLGAATRVHADLEIGLPAATFGQVRDALSGYEFEVAGDGRMWPPDSPAFSRWYQTWASEPAPQRPGGRVYRLDVFREPSAAGLWAFRRDQRIRLPYDRVIRRDRDGLPYLAPELALLFKATGTQPKDEADFAAVLPGLAPAARAWLRGQLQRLHPGHRWIEAL